MQVRKRGLLNAFAYTCLVIGGCVYSFPFVWMVCSSVKVDRELFPEEIQVFPNAPNAKVQSPFIDEDYYGKGPFEEGASLLDLFEEVVKKADFELEASIDRKVAVRHVTQGLAKKLDTILPPATWNQTELEVRKKVEEVATDELLNTLLQRVRRQMLIGQIRIRSYDLEEQEVGKGKSFSNRLANMTPEVLELTDIEDRGTKCAAVHYDFSKGDRWRLETTFDTEFDVSRLHRVRIYLRPDDNWHRLYCYVEKLGVLYEPVQAAYPANFEWGTYTWQEPGPEDETNKIKTWMHFRPADRGAQYVSDPHKLKIVLELRKSTQWQAWWGKISRNYRLTLQHIPLWRYAATSIYLVILNVGLSVIACSIVAYSIARLNWPGRNFCFLLMLATMMVPAQVTMIPAFLIWKNLGFYNTLVPLWLGAAFGAPFSVFLLRQFLKGIPKDLEDSARIDGCGFFRVYWYIMFPLVKPTLAVIGIGAFMGTWNNFMGPLIFISDQRLYPLAYGLYAFAVQVGNNPSLTMAGSFLMTVPIIIVFFFAQRYFIQGVTLTGMKA